MADGDNGFTAPNTDASTDAGTLASGEVRKVTTTTTTREQPFESEPLPTAGAIQSNHNSLHEVNPVLTANLIGKPDYNPMRMTPNRANDASDVTLVPESAKALVDAKGDRDTQRENVLAGRDMAGNDGVKLAGDTVVRDPVTLIQTRPGASLAEKNRDADNAARDAEPATLHPEAVEAARM